MKYLVIVVAAAVIWLLLQPPSADGIVASMQPNADFSDIEYDGIHYSAEWGEPRIHAGALRYIGRADDDASPIITHDATVTTGEFSDPDIVSVTPIRNGSMRWSAKRQPKGTLLVLHFIPTSVAVVEQLEQLGEGDSATFTGREEQDSLIKGSDGRYFGLRHNNHRLFLLEDVQRH